MNISLRKQTLNLVFGKFLKKLGFKKIWKKDILRSHFYEKDNEYIALSSVCLGFLRETGWIRSKNQNISCDNNQIVPWLTYPSINFLNSLDLRKKSILEFGGGASTVYFSKKAKEVFTFESDSAYINGINDRLKFNTNVEIVSYPTITNSLIQTTDLRRAIQIEEQHGAHFELVKKLDVQEFSTKIQKFLQKSDIVLIDGGPRYLITQICLAFIQPETLLIVDNTDREYEKLICSLLAYEGWLRIDFKGLGPLNPYMWTTSIFMRSVAVDRWLKNPVNF